MNRMHGGEVSMFQVVIPVLNQHETTERVVQSWFDLSKYRVPFLFIDNGSDEPLAEQEFFKRWAKSYDVRVHRNEKNIGVYPTFQQGYDLTQGSTFIFYSHNDVEMVEPGWDVKMSHVLQELCWSPMKPGVCGMFGARGIGTPDIYKVPYHFTQLMRWECTTVESMAGAGGEKIQSHHKRVMVLDGFSLIVRRSMLRDKDVVFDHENYPPHHCYDLDICLMSHFAGYTNHVIDVDCIHHGGVTSTRERWAEDMDTTDLKTHRAAHEVMYKKYLNKLPVHV